MTRITITPLFHRNTSQIAIHFKFDSAVKRHIKSFEGVRWSQTHRTFYFRETQVKISKFFRHIRQKGWFLDYSAFRKDKIEPVEVPSAKTKKEESQHMFSTLPQLHKENLHAFAKYMRGLRLSENTLKVYGYFVLRFLYFRKDTPCETLETNDVRRYMEQVIAAEGYSISSHRQCVSALKHYATFMDNEGLPIATLQRPKKDKKLPVVLSKEEIVDLLRVTRNLKHRTILAMLYSGGLRIGELLALRVQDVDMDRMQLHIKRGKGRKDRTVMLARVLQPLLYNYVQTYAPSHFLIEGRNRQAYSASSIRRFLKKSCRLAGILKVVTPHTLRHSFATHMMDNGVALRHIQELLGHAKPETTMIYTHVSQQDLMDVTNPLDATLERLTKNGNEARKVSLSRKLL